MGGRGMERKLVISLTSPKMARVDPAFKDRVGSQLPTVSRSVLLVSATYYDNY